MEKYVAIIYFEEDEKYIYATTSTNERLIFENTKENKEALLLSMKQEYVNYANSHVYYEELKDYMLDKVYSLSAASAGAISALGLSYYLGYDNLKFPLAFSITLSTIALLSFLRERLVNHQVKETNNVMDYLESLDLINSHLLDDNLWYKINPNIKQIILEDGELNENNFTFFTIREFQKLLKNLKYILDTEIKLKKND